MTQLPHTATAFNFPTSTLVVAPKVKNKKAKVVAPEPEVEVKVETPKVEIVNEAVTIGAETITTVAAVNKATIARSIFAECYAQPVVPQRKDIIQRAVNEAGLTKAGAATYLQNYKSKQGLTASKATAIAA